MTRFEHQAITCALLIPAALLFIIATDRLFAHVDFTNSGIGCLLLLGGKLGLDERYARRDDEAGLPPC